MATNGHGQQSHILNSPGHTSLIDGMPLQNKARQIGDSTRRITLSLSGSLGSHLIRHLIGQDIQSDLLLILHGNTILLTISPSQGMLLQPLSELGIVLILLVLLGLLQSLSLHLLGHQLTGLVIIDPALGRHRLNETVIADLGLIKAPLLIDVVRSVNEETIGRETVLNLIQGGKGGLPMALAIYNLKNSHG